jgi:transposase-like protein
MKTAERKIARELRRQQGLSIKTLARMLGVSVSSVSVWVRDIELTAAQREALRPCAVAAGAANAARARERHRKAQHRGREAARRAQPLHTAGCMLIWADLDLPRSSLHKSTVNTYSKYSQKKRRNKLPYGTCRLVVHDTQLVHELYGAIQEYGGFEREEWLL